MTNRQSAPTRRGTQVAVLVAASLILIATGCTSSAAETEPRANSAAPTVEERSEPTATALALGPTITPEPTVTPEPTMTPEPSATTSPTPEPSVTAVRALPNVNAIGDLVPASPGTHITARPDAGFLADDGARIVPVFDVPEGLPRALVDVNNIDGVELTYPLRNPTVFRQPLVLRVIAGTPADEWLLVQAPVRPHRQYVWVRAADFTFGQSSLRIEVDLGQGGLVTLFDRDQALISNQIVFGRESRPTVLHDTYVDQAFEGATLSPAYGTYILTLASYSEALGTFGGGLPGQSLHGTNQPELMGERVSSGGIRVPDQVVDFIYAQPGILGASVIIYDSTGAGRDAAIARERNKPWTRATTVELDPADLPKAPITSYS